MRQRDSSPNALAASRCRWMCRSAWLGTAATLVMASLLQWSADRWWPVIGLLYGPRWMVGALPLLTIPWLMHAPRRGAVPFAAAVIGFTFGILDLRLGAGRLSPAQGTPLRVVEFNIAGDAAREADVVEWLRATRASIVVLVECKPDKGERIGAALGLHVQTNGSLCMLSTFPIDRWESREQLEFWRRGGSGSIVRATIRHPDGGLRVGAVHLATPRNVLDMFRDLSELPFRGRAVATNSELRNDESLEARRWIGDPSDVALIAGDFNLPVESAVYGRHWGDYANAWSDTGVGLGWTKLTRWFGVRIDHVLLGSRLGSRGVALGPGFGSDHRPLVTDLVIR